MTEVVPAGDFWEAEPEHQDYLLLNPGGYTCHFIRPNWTLPRLADEIEKRSGMRISRSRLSVVLRQKGISAGDGPATR